VHEEIQSLRCEALTPKLPNRSPSGDQSVEMVAERGSTRKGIAPTAI
jgi:hypothetical protein